MAVTAATLLAMMVGTPAARAATFEPTDLTVNYATNPLGTEATPMFGWDAGTQKQTAYQIKVSSPTGTEWDSGKVTSVDDLQIPYTGPALASRTRYSWQVKVWDGQAVASDWSDSAWWETGLLSASDWSAQWIGGRQQQDHDWIDQTVTAKFKINNATSGFGLLFHAQPVGKRYGEAYIWKLASVSGVPTLQQQVRHYLGSPYNPNSETNPTNASIATTTMRSLSGAQLGGTVTAENLTTDEHTLTVKVEGDAITTVIDGVTIDTYTPVAANIQKHGTIGVASGTNAIVKSMMVDVGDTRDFSTTFFSGSNPLDFGVPNTTGLPFASTSKDAILPSANPVPLVRKTFSLPKKVVSARLYVAGGGWPKVTLNGKPVTDGLLVPDQTDYAYRVLYHTYDVTSLLKQGGNAIGAELGRGWYGLTTPNEWYHNVAPFHDNPKLLAQIEVTYDDGSKQTVVTDGSWKTADGATTFDSVYNGEKYDARLAKSKWDKDDYDDSAWIAAPVVTGPAGALHAQEAEPVETIDTVKPVSITEVASSPGTYILDYGQIMTGLGKLTAQAPAGTTVRLQYDDELLASGLISGNSGFIAGDLQTYYYTFSGKGVERWTPSFSNSGFRYVQVSGLPSAPTADTLVVQVQRSAYKVTGTVETSNDLLNRIMRNAKWAEWNNTVQKITDTPSREKNGWTGDAQGGSEPMILNNDLSRFLPKWLDNLPDSQISTGEIPEVVPAAKGGYGYENTPGWSTVNGPTPAWDAAIFVIPWELQRYYGNTNIHSRLYSAQKKMMEYYARFWNPANQYTRTTGLGEYAAAGSNGSSAVINMQYYYFFADSMAKEAQLLGKTEDAATYRALADNVKATFISKYWNGTSFTGGNVESANVMAVAFGMVPAGGEANAVKAAADDIVARNYHLGAGIYGMKYLWMALSDHGYKDMLYKVATSTTSPSWGYQIGQGATSLWENWNGGSKNHHYASSILTWYYQGLAGIVPTSDGYRSVRIRPYIPTVTGTSSVPPAADAQSTLDNVDGKIDTVRGLVRSRWTRNDDGTIKLTVTIPNNTSGEIWVPTFGKTIMAPNAAGFTGLKTFAGEEWAVYAVPPGTHAFSQK